MTRSEFVLRLVLDSICNDFENPDQIILPEAAELAARCGLTVTRGEIVSALARLLELGWAKAYDFRDPLSTELQQMPSLEVPDDFGIYFNVTQKGKVQVSDDSWWPFDQNGNLRPDWHLDLEPSRH